MKIFLSHASEQHALADRLAVALRARGDQVFLDRDDLPPAAEFHDRIKRAIERCDLFCFLISPQSVATGRFTLTELGVARRRWPNPAGRVLPIMVERTPLDSVPPYLRAVTILRPEGDAVAEMLSRLEDLRPGWRRRGVAAAAAGTAATGLLAGAVFFLGRKPEGASTRSVPGAPSAPAPWNPGPPELTRLGDKVFLVRSPEDMPALTEPRYLKKHATDCDTIRLTAFPAVLDVTLSGLPYSAQGFCSIHSDQNLRATFKQSVHAFDVTYWQSLYPLLVKFKINGDNRVYEQQNENWRPNLNRLAIVQNLT